MGIGVVRGGLKGIQISLIFWTVFLTVFAQAEVENLPTEVTSFLTSVQEEVLVDFQNLDHSHQQLYDCLKHDICDNLLSNDGATGAPLTGNDVVQYITEVHDQLRMLVGFRNHQFLGQMLDSVARVKPISGAKHFVYNDREEKEKIVAEYQSFLQAMDKEYQKSPLSNQSNSVRARREFNKLMLSQRSDLYISLIKDIVRRFPYLLHLVHKNPSRDNIASAVRQFLSNLDKARGIVASKSGDELFELTGFGDAVQRVFDSSSPEANQKVFEFIDARQDNFTFFGQLLDLVANPTTLGLGGCVVSSYLFQVLKPLRFFCGAIGGARMTYLTLQSYYDMRDFRKYVQTGRFGDEIYRSQMAFYLASVFMSVVFYKSAFPSFVNNTRALKKNLRNSIVKIKRRHKLSVSPRFQENAVKEVKKYKSTWSKDIAVTEVASFGQSVINATQALAGLFGTTNATAGRVLTAKDLMVNQQKIQFER